MLARFTDLLRPAPRAARQADDEEQLPLVRQLWAARERHPHAALAAERQDHAWNAELRENATVGPDVIAALVSAGIISVDEIRRVPKYEYVGETMTELYFPATLWQGEAGAFWVAGRPDVPGVTSKAIWVQLDVVRITSASGRFIGNALVYRVPGDEKLRVIGAPDPCAKFIYWPGDASCNVYIADHSNTLRYDEMRAATAPADVPVEQHHIRAIRAQWMFNWVKDNYAGKKVTWETFRTGGTGAQFYEGRPAVTYQSGTGTLTGVVGTAGVSGNRVVVEVKRDDDSKTFLCETNKLRLVEARGYLPGEPRPAAPRRGGRHGAPSVAPPPPPPSVAPDVTDRVPRVTDVYNSSGTIPAAEQIALGTTMADWWGHKGIQKDCQGMPLTLAPDQVLIDLGNGRNLTIRTVADVKFVGVYFGLKATNPEGARRLGLELARRLLRATPPPNHARASVAAYRERLSELGAMYQETVEPPIE